MGWRTVLRGGPAEAEPGGAKAVVGGLGQGNAHANHDFSLDGRVRALLFVTQEGG